MKTSIASLLALCSVVLALAQPAATFTSTGSMTTPRVEHTATLLTNSKVLITGGWQPSSSGPGIPMLGSAELYDPLNGTFSPAGSMAAGRTFHVAVLLPDGNVLVAGGMPPARPSFMTSPRGHSV